MICKHCGAVLEDDIRVCSLCGMSQEEQAEENIAEKVENTITEVIEENIEPEAVTEEKALPKKEKVFVRGLLSVLCSVLIFVLSFATITIFVGRGSISEKKVDRLIETVDVEELMEKGGLDYLVDAKPEAAAKIFEITDIREYVKSTILQYTEYLRGGEEPKGINADELITLIGEYAYEIEETTGRRVTNRDYWNIQRYFGRESKETVGVLSGEVRTNGLMKTMRAFLSVYAILGFVVLTAACVFLLLKARKNRTDTLIWAAVPVILASVVITVFGTVQPLTLMAVSGFGETVGVIVKVVMDNIKDTVIIGGASETVAGILLIVAYFITKKVNSSKKN